MNITCITHADFESPGVIETWAFQKKYNFQIIKPYLGDACSKTNDIDWLIVMGGPQSPIKIEEAPYLKNEIEMIRSALQKNIPVLGFCLGAQLIGEALGAKTEKSPEREVGVYPITLNKHAESDPIMSIFSNYVSVIHWHNDMPGLTQDAVVLANSEGCPRQIVRYKSNVYGFQCHLEITGDGIKTMIQSCPNDLNPGRFVQNEVELLKQDYDSINQTMFKILDRFSKLTIK